MLCSSLALVAALAAPAPVGEGPNWIADVAKAKEMAAAEGKHLLINFTGSDWCVWCQRLDGDVFDHAEFVTEAEKNFVFLYLDFPNAPELLEKVVDLELNEKLQGHYSVGGFPTIVLADASGRPYAKTGYQEGGPAKYLEHLAELRQGGEAIRLLLDAKPEDKEARVEMALPALFEHGLFSYPGYDEYLAAAKKIDADGKKGWLKKALAYEQNSALEKLAQAQFGGETPPDWEVLARFIAENDHCSGQAFVQIGMVTAMQHLMPNEKWAEARAIFVRVKAEPMLAEVEEAQTELGGLIEQCDEKLAAAKAEGAGDGGGGDDGEGDGGN